MPNATGESVFLSVRRGEETVCLLRQDGAFPIRSFVPYEARRFLLGAGLEVLSFLPEKAIESYVAGRDLAEGHGAGHGQDPLKRRIAETRERGWAINPGLIVEGSWGMGAAVFDAADRPAWALSLTGIESRFTPEHREEMGRLLMHHAHELSKKRRGEQTLPA